MMDYEQWLEKCPITIWMQKKEYKINRIALRVGVSRQTVYVWRTGGVEISDENLEKLAEVMHVSPAVLKAEMEQWRRSAPEL